MKRIIFWALLSLLLAVYFRVPLWKDLPPSVKQNNLKEAEAVVREQVTKQLRVTADLPGTLSVEARNKIIDEKAQEVFNSEADRIAVTVALLQKQLDDATLSRYSKEYLRESDPYYYLSLTKNILENGTLGPSRKDGTFHNPRRNAPDGTWDSITWHPYLGAAAYRLLRIFDENISLPRAVAYVPVAFTFFMTVGVFFLLSALGVRPLLTWLGATVFLLMPAVILRSNYGWYDTDPYILFFSSVILGSLLWAIRTPQKALAYGASAGALTFLFAFFWQGWLYILPLVGIGALSLILYEHLKKIPGKVPHIKYLAAFIFIPILSVIVLLSPQSLWWSFSVSLVFLSKAGMIGGDLWPNLQRLISETNAPTVTEWFFLLGLGTLVFAVLGLFVAGAGFLRRKQDLRFRQWLVATFLCFPLMILSAHARRYVILVAPPLVVLFVLGAEWFINFFSDKVLTRIPKTFRELLAILVVIGVILPGVFLNAEAANEKMPGAMDASWSKALNYLRTETPKDAIVISAWSPGYFVNGLAERRSVVDGGTQNCATNFWIAKAFLSREERQSAGLFRMLAVSGVQALGYVKKLGLGTDDAVALLLKIVSMDRADAFNVLPSDWRENSKQKLLDFTHGRYVIPPVYLLLYSELIHQNEIFQLASRWNFKKAKKTFGRSQEEGFQMSLGREQDEEYFRIVNLIVGESIPFQKPKPVVYSEEDYLVYKDLIIDRVRKNAFMPEKGGSGVEMRPVSLLYHQEGKWIRKPVSDSPSALWAVSFDMDDPKSSRQAMIARKELLDSVLFQLYYFGGENYRAIREVTSQGSLAGANYVRVFRVDFSALDQKKQRLSSGV